MPRGVRIILDNVCYHVINRGNQKQSIFLQDADFTKNLQLLKHYKRKLSLRLFGYCLMPNHVHLIVHLKEPEKLGYFMQALTQVYTVWFNKKYKKSGHLWQGRFKSMVVQEDEYLLQCVYYIETNPVRANIIGSPVDYPWSSYRDRVLGNKNGLLDLPDST